MQSVQGLVLARQFLHQFALLAQRRHGQRDFRQRLEAELGPLHRRAQPLQAKAPPFRLPVALQESRRDPGLVQRESPLVRRGQHRSVVGVARQRALIQTRRIEGESVGRQRRAQALSCTAPAAALGDFQQFALGGGLQRRGQLSQFAHFPVAGNHPQRTGFERLMRTPLAHAPGAVAAVEQSLDAARTQLALGGELARQQLQLFIRQGQAPLQFALLHAPALLFREEGRQPRVQRLFLLLQGGQLSGQSLGVHDLGRLILCEVTLYVQIAPVALLDLAQPHQAQIVRLLRLLLHRGAVGVQNMLDVLLPQRVLHPAAAEFLAGVDNNHLVAQARRFVLVQHHHAGGHAGTVEQGRRQGDHSLDAIAGLALAAKQQAVADAALVAIAEQHVVRHHQRGAAILFQGGQYVLNEGVIAEAARRNAIAKALMLVRQLLVIGLGRTLAAALLAVGGRRFHHLGFQRRPPVLHRERQLRHDAVEARQPAFRGQVLGLHQGVPQFQTHLHAVEISAQLGHRPSGRQFFLAEQLQRNPAVRQAAARPRAHHAPGVKQGAGRAAAGVVQALARLKLRQPQQQLADRRRRGKGAAALA